MSKKNIKVLRDDKVEFFQIRYADELKNKYPVPDDIPEVIEGIYNYSKQYCISNNVEVNSESLRSVCDDVFSNIVYNLSAPSFKNKIVTKKVRAYNIAYMSPQQMNEDAWKKEIDKKATDEENIKRKNFVEGHKCRKCGKQEIYTWQLQTRSGDEPITTFYRCHNCSNTWRI